MKIITKETYNEILDNFKGIVVVATKSSFNNYNADFCIYSVGTDENGIRSFYKIFYNESEVPNGFYSKRVLKEELFKNFDELDYYYFDNFKEFCIHHLEIHKELQKIGKIPLEDDQIKNLDTFIKKTNDFGDFPDDLIERLHKREQQIQDLCKKIENSIDIWDTPTRASIISNKQENYNTGIKKNFSFKQKRRDILKDVITYINKQKDIDNLMIEAVNDKAVWSKVYDAKNNLEKWLDEEV